MRPFRLARLPLSAVVGLGRLEACHHRSIQNPHRRLSGRYLSFAEREEIALYRAQGFGVCVIARKIGRAASTISRELRRNSATRSGGFEYRATTAQWHANRAAKRPRIAKLAENLGFAPVCLRPAVRTDLDPRRDSDRWPRCTLNKETFGPSPAPQGAPGLEP